MKVFIVYQVQVKIVKSICFYLLGQTDALLRGELYLKAQVQTFL